jgi:hypothetical protein
MSEQKKAEGLARRLATNITNNLQPTLLSLNSMFYDKLKELDNTFSGIDQRLNNLAAQDNFLGDNLNTERNKYREDSLAYRIEKRDFTSTTTQDSIDTSQTSVLAVNIDVGMTINSLQNLIFTYDATVYFYAQVKTYDKETGLLGFQITKAAGTPGTYSPWTIQLGDRSISDSFGSTANTVCEGNDPRLSNARTPTAHTHTLSDITQSSAATNEVPAWNGSNWVPATRASLSSTNTFTAKQIFTNGIDLTGALTGPGSGSLTISNGAGDVVITSPITTIGNGAIDFTIDAASGTVDGSAFEWQTGDLSTGTLVTTGNITLQNAERIQNTTNGRVDIAPAPSASSFGLSIDMTSKGTGARLTTVTGTSGTTLSTGVLESLVEFQAPKFTLTTITLNSSVGGVLEYDGKVTYANTASGRGVMVTEQTSILTSSRNINSATGNQNIFGTPQDVISLAANTTYKIRGYLFLSMGTTTTRHIALRFTESVSANPPTIHFSTIGMPSTGGAASRAQDMAYFTTLSGGNMTQSTITNANYIAWITGVITTVDSVTITPQIAFSAAPGNTCSVNMGTFISFIPYGSNTMAAVGPWS